MDRMTDMICNLGFTDDEIAECLKSKGLLSLELEFTKKCNLKCIYCYADAGEPVEGEVSIEELKSVIQQAKKLGAKKVILLGGGEPLIYRGLADIISYIKSLGLTQLIFTNGTLITEEIARFLFINKVSIIIKRNSLKPDVQDMLAGMQGAFEKIERGLRLLMKAGYPARDSMLGIQTIICKQNIDELPEIWTWARENGIIPYFEIMTYQGRAKENMNLMNLPMSDIKEVFERLERIDRKRFSIAWEAHPSIAGFICKRHLYSCLINSQGYVQPCPGVDIHIGNIRENPLEEILNGSLVIANLRNIFEKIEGQCKVCKHHAECYGCRGNAFQITGNYLASDPTCWLSEKDIYEHSDHSCKQ